MSISRIVILLAFAVLLFSCVKDKSKPENKPVVKPVVKPENKLKEIYLPVKIDHEKGSVIIIEYNSKNLVSKYSAENTNYVVTYNNQDQPEKVETFFDKKLVALNTFELNEFGAIKKRHSENFPIWDDGKYYIRYEDYFFNDKQQLVNRKLYENEKLIWEAAYTYGSSGNLNTILFIGQGIEYNYTYGLDNGIFKDVQSIAILAFDGGEFMLSNMTNNPLTFKNSQTTGVTNFTYNYEFNDAGYPVKIISKIGANTSTITVDYKKVTL